MNDPFSICNEITKKSASNLWFVSRGLSKEKHRFFVSCYASMRVIDDFVDNDFLPLSFDERSEKRMHAIDTIANWRENSINSAQSKICKTSNYPEIFQALSEVLGKSTLGEGPWQRLADAMLDDVKETPLLNWDDFLQYCVGATIAPAEVFLYVLACNVDKNLCYSADENLNFRELAHEMAIFCYLVHIMRDIAKDAQQGGQLITIPLDLLTECGLSRDEMGNNAAKLEKLILKLIDKADALLPVLNKKESFLKKKLQRRERLILSTLLGIYRRLFDKIKSNPHKFVAGDVQGLHEERQAVEIEHQSLEERS